jgi:hypothetical protein
MTRNQVVAFIVAVVISLFLILAGFRPSRHAGDLGQPMVRRRHRGIQRDDALRQHPEGCARFARHSLLRIVIVFCLFATSTSSAPIARADSYQRFFNPMKKGLQTSLFSIAGVAVMAVILIAVNWLGSRAKARIDLTEDRAYTLSAAPVRSSPSSTPRAGAFLRHAGENRMP